MKRSYLVATKVLVWIACLLPLAKLIYEAVIANGLGPDPTARITHSTGYTTLMILTISLAVTPVRRLSPRLGWLIKFRRLLGLFAFFYATLHLLTWVALYTSFDVAAMSTDILKRRYITAGMGAWLLLLPLALTSTNWAIRKLGGKTWNRLHKLVYIAVILGVIHYWWQVKTGVMLPLPFTIAVAVLLLARPVQSWWLRSRAKSAPASGD